MITLELSGLTCDHCVRAVTNALKEVEGVGEVEVTLTQAVVHGTACPTKLMEAIREEGYEVKVS